VDLFLSYDSVLLSGISSGNIMNDLASPSARVTVARSCSPTGRFHMIKYDTFCVAIVAVLFAVNGAVVPAMNWVNGLTIWT